MLRAEARRRAGHQLTQRVAKELDSWLTRLRADGTVVHYDRGTEEGWHYVPRRPLVDRDLVREPGGVAQSKSRDGKITTSVVLVYPDGTRVPFDPLLL